MAGIKPATPHEAPRRRAQSSRCCYSLRSGDERARGRVAAAEPAPHPTVTPMSLSAACSFGGGGALHIFVSPPPCPYPRKSSPPRRVVHRGHL